MQTAYFSFLFLNKSVNLNIIPSVDSVYVSQKNWNQIILTLIILSVLYTLFVTQSSLLFIIYYYYYPFLIGRR